MHIHPTLAKDIANLKPDAQARLRPGVNVDHFHDTTVAELKETFKTYGVEVNDETLKAAAATAIWIAAASQQMFLFHVPNHIDHTPLSHAVHGPLVALDTIITAIERR